MLYKTELKDLFLRITTGKLMHELKKTILANKSTIWSLHDINVGTMLAALSDFEIGQPGFASFIALEIQDEIVKLRFRDGPEGEG